MVLDAAAAAAAAAAVVVVVVVVAVVYPSAVAATSAAPTGTSEHLNAYYTTTHKQKRSHRSNSKLAASTCLLATVSTLAVGGSEHVPASLQVSPESTALVDALLLLCIAVGLQPGRTLASVVALLSHRLQLGREAISLPLYLVFVLLQDGISSQPDNYSGLPLIWQPLGYQVSQLEWCDVYCGLTLIQPPLGAV